MRNEEEDLALPPPLPPLGFLKLQVMGWERPLLACFPRTGKPEVNQG